MSPWLLLEKCLAIIGAFTVIGVVTAWIAIAVWTRGSRDQYFEDSTWGASHADDPAAHRQDED